MHARKSKTHGWIIAVLFILAALVIVLSVSPLAAKRPSAAAGSSSSGAPDPYAELLSRLEGQITPDMALNECDPEYAAALRELAAEKPEQADRLNFIARHIDIYSEAAVKTAMQSEEKLNFALEIPFRAPDSSGLDALADLSGGGLPYFRQYDARWGYHAYGSGVLGITGCGPTCLAMAAAGLTRSEKINPAAVADFASEHGYYAPGAGTAWTLFTEGAAEFGLACEELPLDENIMKSRLDSGAVLVLSMLPGDFTETGHFIIIDKYDSAGFGVLDPNSPELSAEAWPYERISGQIANLWSLSAR